jgi:dihydrofolate reductase
MATPLHIALVAAAGRNRVIGRGGELPWHLGTDLARFRRLTRGRPMVMGRKTFETIGRPLPHRLNIVITRNPAFAPAGVETAPSLDAALERAATDARARGVNEISVIGGGEIYAQALPLADRIYLTEVDAAPEGDAYFPSFDPTTWTVVRREAHPAGPQDDHAFVFVDYARDLTPKPESAPG